MAESVILKNNIASYSLLICHRIMNILMVIVLCAWAKETSVSDTIIQISASAFSFINTTQDFR